MVSIVDPLPRRFTPFPRSAIGQSIPARFEEQARRYPDRLAVKSQRDAWSYAELDGRADQIARAILAARGDGQGPVALLLPQGALLVAATLGVLKAGRIYVPLDAAFPGARLAELLADCQATLVAADAERRPLAESVAPPHARVLEVGGAADRADARARLEVPADASAYIYYTSGSTGRPKGVLDTHRNVLHNVMRYTNSLRIGPDDRLTLLQGPSFSGAVSSMFAALLNGAAVFPYDVPAQGADRIADWLRREEITIYHSVPSLFRHVAPFGESLPALRLIRLEGDRAAVTDIALFQAHFSADCTLVNGLGATECGLVRQYFVGRETPVPASVVPIGYPVEDMDVVLLDESGREALPGQVGEIAVRSRYLVPGYWRRPDLTAAAFVADPRDPLLRTYRTGDLGRLRPDGCLEHLGRTDSQVKIHGNRVEAAEVEAALLGSGRLREAAVVTREDDGDEPRLVAYVVPGPDPPTVSALRRDLAERLPEYMIPSVYVALDALPLNANRKVDRRALPVPDGRRPPLDEAFVGPRTLFELELARIWGEVLRVEPVGIRDSFFDLGGSSLLALRMIERVEHAIGRKVPLSVMLSGPTVEHLAEAIQEEAAELRAPIVAVQTSGGEPPFFFLHGDYLSGGFFSAGLARHLGPDQPFYAVPPCGADGQAVPASYQEMARWHLDAILSVSPRGPYRLGGLCNGGLVAFEVARLLSARGERVERLVVVGASASNAAPAWVWLRRLARWTGAARGREPGHRASGLLELRDALDRTTGLDRARAILTRPRRVFRLLAAAMPDGLPAPTGNGATSRETLAARRERLRNAYLDIDAAYVPGRYAGRVALLWPSEDPLSPARAARWWQRLAAEVDAHVVPGTHVTCLTDHVRPTAEVLRRCLRTVGPS
jgi:amino acid adenylation domain-containing protein